MTAWHLDATTTALFARDPRGLDEMTAASAEMHLAQCDACRRAVAEAADPTALARSWAGLSDRVDVPRHSPVERLLGAVWPSDRARLVAATPALRLASMAVMVVLVLGVMVACRELGSAGPLLVVAPFLPLAAIAAVLAAPAEPGGEVVQAAPLWGAPLLLRRAEVVLLACVGVLALASLPVALVDRDALAWVLPAAALTSGALALSTWMPAVRAVVLASAGWIVVLAVLWHGDAAATAVARLWVFQAPGQGACAAVLVTAIAVLGRRRDRLVGVGVR